MSCEFLIGIDPKGAAAIEDSLKSANFIFVGDKLNSYPFKTDELNLIVNSNRKYDWFVAMNTAYPDLEIASELSKSIDGYLGVLLDVCKELHSFAVFFSDSGTNQLEVIKSLSVDKCKAELRWRYGDGAPNTSTLLLFGPI